MTEPTLREYIDMRFEEMDKRFTNRFEAQETAIGKAEAALSERLNTMNEFRATISDQAKHFITRPEHDKLDNDVRTLQREKANLDGRISITVIAVSTIVSFVMSGLLLMISHFWMNN
jgi:hypothetical protein